MPHDPHDVLAYVEGYLNRLERKNAKRAAEERKVINAILQGKAYIERHMLCKNCKWYSLMIGKLTILRNTQQLRRDFTCSECRLPAHTDYIQMPRIQSIRISTK
jgi:hypothetical protein